MKQTIIFEEVQYFRQWWLWSLLGVEILLGIYTFVRQILFNIPVGNNPASDSSVVILFIFLVMVIPTLFLTMSLRLQIRNEGIYFKFFPFHWQYKQIQWNEIKEYKAINYNPILDCGGWGIKYGRYGICYNVSGNKGLTIVLINGKKILFGSQNPDILEKKIKVTIK